MCSTSRRICLLCSLPNPKSKFWQSIVPLLLLVAQQIGRVPDLKKL